MHYLTLPTPNRRPLIASIIVGLLCHVIAGPSAMGQLQTLSAGDADRQWREAQLQAFDLQLADTKLPEELKRELAAQRDWLKAWDPKQPAGAPASPADEQPADQQPEAQQEKKQATDSAEPIEQAGETENQPMKEPAVDPDGLAEELRSRLFDPKRPASASDTKALQTALSDHSGDVGLRQLQLHWIDQPIYRDAHWQEISSASDRVLGLLSDLPATEETKAAAAFANYRKARALAHALRARPLRGGKIASIDKLSQSEREQMQNAIGECWRQIETLVGAGRPEFFQLEIYNLRRYGWSGQALEMLERNAGRVDEVEYLAERQSILHALGWTKPAEQTASALRTAKKLAGDAELKRAFEIQYVPDAQSTGK